jgi:hypothetical protein
MMDLPRGVKDMKLAVKEGFTFEFEGRRWQPVIGSVDASDFLMGSIRIELYLQPLPDAQKEEK